mmetsp:Transcript_2597/g.4218  ORF Transcript_2597/g.4218 Transcript_2597/m.4218 type:complete len:871 (+) Transcript_2597:124-2736(+)
MPRRTRRSQVAAASIAYDADEPIIASDIAPDEDDQLSLDDYANTSTSEKMWNNTQSVLSNHLLPLVSKPEDLLTSLLNKDASATNARVDLVAISQQLFRYIEHLAHAEEELKAIQKDQKLSEIDPALSEEEEEKVNDCDDEPCTLSGLASLYTGESSISNDDGDDGVDAETIWGQVDLQNTALVSRLKKNLKKLVKRSSNDEKKYGPDDLIQLLEVDAMDSNEEGDSMASGSNDEDNSDEGSADSHFDDYEYDGKEDQGAASDEDSDARRIRERMERAMEDMSDDNDDDAEIESGSDVKQQRLAAIRAKAAEEEAIDPTREEMRDGFFDLHEMEAFADEEEEFLPNVAYGQEIPEEDKNEKVLPHVRDRVGKESDDEEGVDDEFEDEDNELTKRYESNSVRRRKYRADDEVDLLYQLYDGDANDSNDEDPEEMTAADFFGKPDPKLIKRYKEQQKNSKNKSNDMKFDDDDSWNDEFAEDGLDWKDGGEKVDMESDGDDAEEETSDEENGDDEGSMGEEEDDKQKLSTHDIKSKKLEEQTLRLEEEMMAEKPWRMLGEAKGTNRPSDSLLDSTPEFEVAFKPPPIITAGHTADIEEIIKKRIIEEDWDDVIPRELPDIGASKRGGDAPEVSQEKSKLGLGELYEREYLKKTTGFDRDAHDKETEEDAAKEEMKKLFADLCSHLDALSNYHFAPRPVADEADVQNREDVPAIAMEEVLPLHMSKSRGVAPEEVYGAGKGRASVLKGESEMDQTERKRLRNAKKSSRRKARKQKEADEKLISKLQPGLGLNNPYEKRKLREELQMARASGKVIVAKDSQGWQDEAATGKEYQTSAKFFQKMQENVESIVREGEGDGRAKKRAKTQEGSSSYKL